MRNWAKALCMAVLVSVLSHFPTGEVLAAEVFESGFAEEKSNSFEWPYKNITLRGNIERGDLAKIQKLIGHPGHSHHVRLVLDSSGGNFFEAVEIALYVHYRYAATHVAEGSKCLSACAVIFMAGSQHNGDGNRLIDRSMHVSATLGFHAPFISGQLPQSVPGQLVTKAYNEALKTASEFLRVSSSIDWPNSLTLELLKVPSDEFIFVDTIGRAGRWGINLTGVVETGPLDRHSAFQMCRNHFDWEFERQQTSRANTQLYNVGDDLFEMRRREDGAIVFSFPQEMGTDCEVIVEGERINVKLDGARAFYRTAHWWHSRKSETQISAIADGFVAAPSEFSLPEFATSGRQVDFYMHNRSKMKFAYEQTDNGTSLVITYDNPRKGMRKEGVRSGTVLFTGMLEGGGHARGRARIFRKGCEPVEYDVNGKAEPGGEQQVVLWGLGKSWRGRSCRTREHRKIGKGSGKLIFEPLTDISDRQ